MKSIKDFLVDVDGVCAAFLPHLLGVLGNPIEVDQVADWDFNKYLSEEDAKRARRILNDPNFWDTLPVIPGAKKTIKEWVLLGHRIIWVTSPYAYCPNWADVRRSWLYDNFGASPDQVIIVEDKSNVPGDIFIDDKISNVVGWQKNHPEGEGLLFKAPYNEKYDYPREFSW